MNDILRPITDDGLVGYDQFDQLMTIKQEKEGRVSWFIADVRDKICPVCAHGWEPTAVSMQNQQYWYARKQHAHATCLARYSALNDYDFWYRTVCDARIRFEGLTEIPNGYHAHESRWERPWYCAQLLDSAHQLKFGWRKRVWHMEILPAANNPINVELATKLFEKEDVTKAIDTEHVMIHAWGDAKAKEYLQVFKQILGVQR